MGQRALQNETAEAVPESIESETVAEAPENTSTLSGISPDLLKSLDIETETVSKTSEPSEETSEDADPEAVLESNEETEDKPEGETPAEPEVLHEIKHDGVTRSLTQKELLDYAQKGFDYTSKTMTLAEDRKKQEEEWNTKEEENKKLHEDFVTRQSEMSDVMQLKAKWDFYINSVERSDPDLFDQIQAGFNEQTAHFSNPLIDAQMKRVEDELQVMKSASSERENAKIRQEFDDGLKVQEDEWKDDFEKLGLKLDPEKVRKEWIDGAETVKQAVLNVYAGDMIKLLKSKNKTAAVKKKVQSTKAPITSGKVNAAKEVETPTPPLRKQSWEQLLHKVQKEYVEY